MRQRPCNGCRFACDIPFFLLLSAKIRKSHFDDSKVPFFHYKNATSLSQSATLLSSLCSVLLLASILWQGKGV